MQQIYLDHNATTPLRPDVLEAMLPYLHTHFGNPSSVHRTGRRAKQGLEEAREQIAACIRATPAEVLFTSGGTESNSLALIGAVRAQSPAKTHIITTPVEHSSVLACVQALSREGFSHTLLPVDAEGRIRVDDLAAALRDDTAVVSIGLANPELGTLQPIAACSRLTHQRGVVLHVDAVQATGKLPLDMEELGADVVSLSAHKIYGPKGIGALYVRHGTGLVPVLRGGPQEREKTGRHGKCGRRSRLWGCGRPRPGRACSGIGPADRTDRPAVDRDSGQRPGRGPQYTPPAVSAQHPQPQLSGRLGRGLDDGA